MIYGDSEQDCEECTVPDGKILWLLLTRYFMPLLWEVMPGLIEIIISSASSLSKLIPSRK